MSGARGGHGQQARILCKVEGCGRDLVEEKDYYRRYKVCQAHASDPCVIVRGSQQRFCQQCGTFHAVSEFDLDKRSCRHALSLHNIKRRKRAPEGGGASGGSAGAASQRRRSACAALASGAEQGASGANAQQDGEPSREDIQREAAERFELVAAALRRGETVGGLQLSQPPAGSGAYPHTSLGTSSLPPRWRAPPGLERASGSSGGSGDATLFRSVSDDPADARAAATAAVAAGLLSPSVLPPGYSGLGAPPGGGSCGGGAGPYAPGRLLTNSAPHQSMAELMAEIAANEYAGAGGGPLVQRAAQVAAATMAASAGPTSEASAAQANFLRTLSGPSMQALTPEEYTALVAAAMAAQQQQQQQQQASATEQQTLKQASDEAAAAAAGSPVRRGSLEQRKQEGAAATPPRPQPTVTMELTEEEAALIRARRGRSTNTRALTDVAASLQLLSGASGSGEAAAGDAGRGSAFQPYGGRGTTPPPASVAAAAAAGAAGPLSQWPLEVLQLGLARAAAARNDPNAVQALADALRRQPQVPASDLWHAALVQPQGQSGPPSATKPLS